MTVYKLSEFWYVAELISSKNTIMINKNLEK